MGIVTNPRTWRAPPPPQMRHPRLPFGPRACASPTVLIGSCPRTGRALKPAMGFYCKASPPPVRAAPGRGGRRCRCDPPPAPPANKISSRIPKNPCPLVIASDTCRSGSGFPLSRTRRRYDSICCIYPPTPWTQQKDQPFDIASGTDRWPERRTPIQALRSGHLLFIDCKISTLARVTNQ